MLLGAGHYVKNSLYELERDILVEQITHGVDKNHLWFLPFERSFEHVGVKRNLEPISVLCHSHCMQPPSHPSGITVVTPGAYGATAGNRVPRGVGPFY